MGTQICWHISLGLPSPQTEKINYHSFSQPVFGILLQQPKEPKTDHQAVTHGVREL